MASLALRNVCKSYPNGFHAVKDFNLDIRDGEFIIFVGPSGCGKSTTLRMIAGLEDITSGELWIDGKLVNFLDPKDRDLSMVFQNYTPYPHMSVYDNMAFSLKIRKMDKEEIRRRVHEAARILEGKILGDINEVHIALFKLMTLAMDEGREEDAEEIAKIGQKTAEAYGLWGYNSILIPMELAVRQQDVRESVRYIREMIQAAKKPWTMPDIPLYRHISQQKKDDQREDKTESEHNMEKILPVLLKELKTDPRYDFLRGDEEFQELIGE